MSADRSKSEFLTGNMLNAFGGQDGMITLIQSTTATVPRLLLNGSPANTATETNARRLQDTKRNLGGVPEAV